MKKDPKIKDMFAIGNAFQAILDRDASVFYDAIDNLLLAHKGKAKHGILRETPEGFLCLPAMSLAFAGYRHGITTKVDNEYFSNEYLALLIHSDMDRSTGKL